MTLPAADVVDVTLRVNGAPRVVRAVPARTNLADLLREHLGLTGTHLGCEHGVCGACTVQLDGQPIRSCIQLAAACDGADVVTVEGLEGPAVDALREAFSAEHGLQCGFCTPGMLVSCHDVVGRCTDLDEDTARQELAGNLCRCTGYAGIVRAVVRARAQLAGAPDVTAPSGGGS
ncbi:MAG TPA: (2Fe-2S)-binding protein [Mycobacteriales bacterium]|nr:(2Fe-2S)-binding protein [Mycobacteriales bacterium]